MTENLELSLSFTITALLNSLSDCFPFENSQPGPLEITEEAWQILDAASFLIGEEILENAVKLLKDSRITRYISEEEGSTSEADAQSPSARFGFFSIDNEGGDGPGNHVVLIHAWHCDCMEFTLSAGSDRPPAIRPQYNEMTPASEFGSVWCWGGYITGVSDTSPPVCAHVTACALLMAAPGLGKRCTKEVRVGKVEAALLMTGRALFSMDES